MDKILGASRVPLGPGPAAFIQIFKYSMFNVNSFEAGTQLTKIEILHATVRDSLLTAGRVQRPSLHRQPRAPDTSSEQQNSAPQRASRAALIYKGAAPTDASCRGPTALHPAVLQRTVAGNCLSRRLSVEARRCQSGMRAAHVL